MSQFVDARTQAPDPAASYDVCVVGAGAAGITLALRLAAKGRRVLLLESGGMALDGPTQALYTVEQTGQRYYDMTACRLRFFGGTTNHWGGYCRENDPIDYVGRPALGVPAWPFGYEHLRPYVVEAASLLGLKQENFDPAHLVAERGLGSETLFDRHSDLLTTKVFQLSRQLRFRERFEAPLGAAPNIATVTFANVVHLQADPSGRRIDHLEVRTINGKSFRARATRFVLAAHAVENARLLLASNDVLTHGLGNRHGHVGRYFMEHAYILSGFLYPSPRFPGFYNSDIMRALHLNANLSLTDKAMQQQGILQYYCRFNPVYGAPETADALRELNSHFWRPADIAAIRAFGVAVSHVPEAYRFVGGKLFPQRVAPLAFQLDHRIEQAPNPDSRITLAAERDAVGVRKAVLSWQLNDLDVRTFQRGQKIVVDELTRLGAGRFIAPEITRDALERHAQGHYHHIGTTRMSQRPEDGVVDPDLKVHGLDNLYVAGSGVFPTAGYSGPTMMIVALSMRLADHLLAR